MKITVQQVLKNLKDSGDGYKSFEYSDNNGNELALDFDTYSKVYDVYCADKCLYTFCKQFESLNHAVNSINKFFNS